MKIISYIKQLLDAVKRPIQKNNPEVGKRGYHSVERCEAKAETLASKPDVTFGVEHAKKLHIMRRETRDLVQKLDSTTPVQSEVQATTNQLIRALRRIIGSIRTAFYHCFVATPVNIALHRELNELDLLLAEGETPGSKINPQQLKKLCEGLEKIAHHKEWNSELSPLVNDVLGLTRALANAFARGETIVMVPVVSEPLGSEPDSELVVDQEPSMISERELTELLNEDNEELDNEFFAALEVPYRSGLLPELSPEQIAVVLDGKGQQEGIPTIQSMVEAKDFKSILRLQEKFPNEFKTATNFPVLLFQALQQQQWLTHKDLTVRKYPDEPVTAEDDKSFDAEALLQLVSFGLEHLTDDGLEVVGEQTARLLMILRTMKRPETEPVLRLYNQVKGRWVDIGHELHQLDEHILPLTCNWDREIKIQELMSFFEEESLVVFLQKNPLFLRELITKAIRQGYKEFIPWLLQHSLSIATAEVASGFSVFSEFGTKRFTHEQVSQLLELGADMAAVRPSGNAAFNDSKTFPYEHQIILRADDPNIPLSRVERLYNKNNKSSAVYTWNMWHNKLNLEMGKRRPFTGDYKMVISAHGNAISITGGGFTEFYAQNIASKLETMIRSNGGVSPKKITLESCVTARNLPLFGCFAENLTMALHKRGIDTVVSASTGFSQVLSSGRKASFTSVSLTSVATFAMHTSRTYQTKDKNAQDRFGEQGFTQTTGLKREFWVENGKMQSRSR